MLLSLLYGGALSLACASSVSPVPSASAQPSERPSERPSEQPSEQPAEPEQPNTTDERVISIAQDHLIQGQDALTRGDLSGAIASFRSAHRFIPDVKNLITIAGIQQRLGDCPGAYQTWIDALMICQDCQYKDMIFKRFTEGTRPCTSTLRVNSMPSAYVKLDELKLWKTPVEIPALHGSHTIELSEVGYVTTQRALNLDPSREVEELDVTLDLQGVSVTVGPLHAPPPLNWGQQAVPPNTDLRFKSAIGFFAVSVIGVGVTTFMLLDTRQPNIPVVSVLGGLSASFLLAGVALLP